MITNLLERETFVQQVRSAGVTQNVRAIVRQMATQSSNSKRDGAGGMARLHWPMRSAQQEKNETRGALWAHHLQILEDGVSHLLYVANQGVTMKLRFGGKAVPT